MRLVRLSVENLAGVKAAQVEFGPGLNVLYGPNETGKSTLAQAIRGALLLQHTSSAHEPWVPWGTDLSPSVELVFQTEPQRFWRVKKTFGDRGTATLDESKDGVTFTNLAKARRVDGELRKLLRWGIPEPGPKAPKGWPETYLTAALLSPQDDVMQVLSRDLTKDTDASGKELLTNALQALAAHPLFVKVLAEVQGKVDEAYTATGQKRSGRDSPFRRIDEQIKADESRLKQFAEQVHRSQEVETRLVQWREQRAELAQSLEQRQGKLAADRQAWEQRRGLEQRLAAAKAEFERVDKLHRAVAEKEQELTRLQAAADATAARLAAQATELQTAEQAAAVAQEKLRHAQSDERVAARQLEQSQLERRLLELDAEAAEIQKSLDLAAKVRDLQAKLAATDKQLADARAKLADKRQQFEELKKSESAAQTDRKILDGVDVWLRRLEATRELTRIEDERKAAESLQHQARDKRSQGEKLQNQIAKRKLPTAEQLVELRQLSRELHVAEAKLEVGVSVTVSPLKKFDGAAACDNQRSKKQTFAEETTFEADSRVKLTVGNLAEIVVTGGKPDARRNVTALRKRWNAEGQPLLEAAGVETVEELETACREADEHSRRARDLLREADSLDSRAKESLARCSHVDELRAKAAEIETAWAAQDHVAVEQRLARESITARDLDRLRKKLDETAAKARAQVNGLEVETARDETRLQSLEADQTRLRGELASSGEVGPAASMEARFKANRDEHRSTKQRLDSLSRQANEAVQQLQQQAALAEQKLQQMKSALAAIQEAQSRAAADVARCLGELEERRKSAADAPLAAAKQSLAEAEAAWSTVPAADRLVSPESLAAEQAQVAALQRQLQELDRQIAEEEGALKHVGGDVARERFEALQEAIEKRRQQEAEMELDFASWKLLRDTLREVEHTDAQHLGHAIVPAITARFRELTGGRFGDLDLGPQLESRGIQAEGALRDLNLLSVGTREQLSVLLRITLAEQLETVVLLDDQLTQSDPRRLAHFRRLLQEAAKKAQILVFTCRPEDYVLAADLPGDSEPIHDSDAKPLRVVNLRAVLAS